MPQKPRRPRKHPDDARPTRLEDLAIVDPHDSFWLQRHCSDELALWRTCARRICRRTKRCAATPLLCFEVHLSAIQERMQPWRPILGARAREISDEEWAEFYADPDANPDAESAPPPAPRPQPRPAPRSATRQRRDRS